MNNNSQFYSIEPATAADALEIAQMHNQSWYDTYPNETLNITKEYLESIVGKRLSEQGLDFRRDMIERSKAESDYFLRIAKTKSGEIVGFIDGFLSDDRYELAGLYTEQKTHGSGLGQLLWQSFLEWTDPSKVVWLSVVTYNKRAIAFYRKIGFVDLPETERIYGETIIPVIDMEKYPMIESSRT